MPFKMNPMKNTVSSLFTEVKTIIENAKRQIVRNVNSIIVYSYIQIGKRIVEFEQQGNNRAEYAEETIKKLSQEIFKENLIF